VKKRKIPCGSVKARQHPDAFEGLPSQLPNGKVWTLVSNIVPVQLPSGWGRMKVKAAACFDKKERATGLLSSGSTVGDAA